MAVLSDQNRASLQTAFASELSSLRESCTVSRADLRAAVNALDDFLNTNAAAINTAIPQPARSNLSTPQKARLLSYVIRYRYINGA